MIEKTSISKFMMLTDEQLLELGSTIARKLSPYELAQWSARVLTTAVNASGSTPAVDELVRLSSDTDSWAQCKEHFSILRKGTLRLERQGLAQSTLGSLILLAENVAKVLYNATGPSAPFDLDAAEWIPRCTRHLCEKHKECGVER